MLKELTPSDVWRNRPKPFLGTCPMMKVEDDQNKSLYPLQTLVLEELYADMIVNDPHKTIQSLLKVGEYHTSSKVGLIAAYLSHHSLI